MTTQDPSDPTGVSGRGKEAARARQRKATAAVQLRLSGATWEEIAKAVGYATPRQACITVERTLEKQFNDTDREKMRDLAGMRLERLLRGLWAKAVDPEHPEHLSAATKARENIAQWTRLYGLDAPTEVVVHSPTQAELEAWVARVTSVGLPQVEEYDILDVEAYDDDEEEGPRALSS